MNFTKDKGVVSLSHVWKIFGDRSSAAYEAILKSPASKQEILEKYRCVVAVADVSFQVLPGEIYCVMGLSGSGKSTLVRHINRLLEPTSGEIFVNGVNMMSLSDEELQKFRNQHIAMVFQNFALMPHHSVLENIAMPLDIRGLNKNDRFKIAEASLDLVELSGWGNHLVHELSGGMQQRVGLARALASDPDILLMDEPFSALDPVIKHQLQNQFIKLAKEMNKTTVFITHDLDEAIRLGSRIAVMRDGRLIQEGTPEEIVMNPIDDYVSEFVAGISKLKVVQASTMMRPIKKYESEYGPIAKNDHHFKESDSFKTLMTATTDHEGPLVICDSSDRRVGVITRQDLVQMVVKDIKTL